MLELHLSKRRTKTAMKTTTIRAMLRTLVHPEIAKVADRIATAW
jgi:hypothetical protein